MSANSSGAGLQTALKVGLACGVAVAVIKLYDLVLSLANSGISQTIYQTSWLLTAFIFALAGIWAVRRASPNINKMGEVALYSGAAGAIVGIFYAAAVMIVGLIDTFTHMYYWNDPAYILGMVVGVIFSSALWLPVIVAVAVLGGLVYATFMAKPDQK